MTDIAGSFAGFLGQFQAQTVENLKHMTELSNQLSDLAKRYDDGRHDLDLARTAGRDAKRRAEELDAKLKALEDSMIRGAFVLVLVDADADAYMFNDMYYAGDPAEGGERAAVDLQTAVQSYLKLVDPGLATLSVVTKAFASGEGLATLLAKAGMAAPGDSPHVVSRFTRGFSQASDMGDFVLVGKGKDRADHKLMGAFRQFVENPTCQHVLLACCHDNGYVRMLEKFVHSREVVKKVTLVKSFQTGSEFAGLPFRSTTMGSVFRTRALGSDGGGSPSPTIKTIALNGTLPGLGDGAAEFQISSPNQPSKKSSPPMTYATRAAIPQVVLPLQTSTTRPLPVWGTVDKNIILLNADAHRIDMPLPPKSAVVSDNFNRKMYSTDKRYCNMFHLYNSCAGGCNYSHEKLTAAEKLVMRHRLRGQKCLDRGKCRDPLCFYGHHCACSAGNGTGKKCSFPVVMHGVDLTSWREVSVGLEG